MSTEVEVIAGEELVQQAGMIPQVNPMTITRLEAAVMEVDLIAREYQCQTQDDYALGDQVIARTRKLESFFTSVHKPLKDWWTAGLAKAREQEQARLGPLAAAKKSIGARMLAWKAAEDKRIADERKAQTEAERKAAEDRRLAQAEAIAARGRETHNPALEQAALDMLDKPLDIVPAQTRQAKPAGTVTKTVKRLTLVGQWAWRLAAGADGAHVAKMTDADWEAAKQIKGKDLEDLIICVGATLLAQREDVSEELRQGLKPYSSRCAEAAALTANTTWITAEARQRGEAFKLGGVQAVYREGLG